MHRICLKFQNVTLYVPQLTNTVYVVGPLRLVGAPPTGGYGAALSRHWPETCTFHGWCFKKTRHIKNISMLKLGCFPPP